MTKFFKILFTLIILGTSFSSLDAEACSKMKDTAQKKSCCKTEKKKIKGCSKSKKIAKNQEKHEDCAGNCDHSSCKCVAFFIVSVLPTTLDLKYDFQFLYNEISISYLQVSDTTAGFYSNWQPPKIN